ncbi:hypothetical protein A3197_16685 [Candidatus Thiodiazotropha endoloripes]|nr:hypothetical protein A3197_16685 [Candidatus Thiodiazotropha endoloripes]
MIFDKDTAISVAMQILREPGDFIGFIGTNEKVLQFYYEDDGRIWVEHPSQKDGGSFGKYIPVQELEPILINLPEKFHKMCIPNLEFRSW